MNGNVDFTSWDAPLFPGSDKRKSQDESDEVTDEEEELENQEAYEETHNETDITKIQVKLENAKKKVARLQEEIRSCTTRRDILAHSLCMIEKKDDDLFDEFEKMKSDAEEMFDDNREGAANNEKKKKFIHELMFKVEEKLQMFGGGHVQQIMYRDFKKILEDKNFFDKVDSSSESHSKSEPKKR